MNTNHLKKFISYYRQYKNLLLADLFCALIVAGISLALPLCTRYITNTLLKDGSFNLSAIINVGILMIALTLIQFICNYFVTYKGHMMGTYMEHDLRKELFEHYEKLSYSFYDTARIGALMSRLTNDLVQLTELYHHCPEDIVICSIKFIGAFVILFRINPKLTLVVYATLPFMAVFAYFYHKKYRIASKEGKRTMGEINASIEDSLSGIRVIKSFGNEESELARFEERCEAYVEAKRKRYHAMALFGEGVSSVIVLVQVLVIISGSLFISNGSIVIGDLLTFLLYIGNFTEPIKRMIEVTMEQFQEGFTGFERFMEIIEMDPEIKDKENAKTLENVQGSICIDDVSFKYKTGNMVLENVSMDIRPGEYVALVGSSGAGKTTLCSLIPRFYDVLKGSILIDGMDIRDVTQESLRKNIATVQQNVYLFQGTVKENIERGKPGASDEEIIKAAKFANADSFIRELPEGYDTNIGSNGARLSGGQRQRIAIAMAFLKNPQILIFDEATSALDNESEKLVQDSLERLAKGRTTLVIAHRLSTIRNADRIVVLNDKGVAEEGTHLELLEKNGEYAHLYNMQFEGTKYTIV